MITVGPNKISFRQIRSEENGPVGVFDRFVMIFKFGTVYCRIKENPVVKWGAVRRVHNDLICLTIGSFQLFFDFFLSSLIVLSGFCRLVEYITVNGGDLQIQLQIFKVPDQDVIKHLSGFFILTHPLITKSDLMIQVDV